MRGGYLTTDDGKPHRIKTKGEKTMNEKEQKRQIFHHIQDKYANGVNFKIYRCGEDVYDRVKLIDFLKHIIGFSLERIQDIENKINTGVTFYVEQDCDYAYQINFEDQDQEQEQTAKIQPEYIVVELQTNPFYNVDNRCNYQYCRIVKKGDVVLILEDTSCTRGRRWTAQLLKNGKTYDYGTADYVKNVFNKFRNKDSQNLFEELNKLPVQKYYQYGDIDQWELKQLVLDSKIS